MTKTKTNKWVEGKKKEFEKKFKGDIGVSLSGLGVTVPIDGSLNEVWKTVEEFITQTQQETLGWCLKEVKKMETGMGTYDSFLDSLRQIIKNKMEEKWNYVSQSFLLLSPLFLFYYPHS